MVTTEYLAGYFDGDGCVAAMRSSSGWALRASVVSGDYEVLRLFSLKFGGRFNREYCYKGKRIPLFSWRITGRNAVKFFAEISPYLVAKRPQAELAATWPFPDDGTRETLGVSIQQQNRRNRFTQHQV